MIIDALIILISLSYVILIISFAVGLRRVLDEKIVESTKRESLTVIVAFRNEEANLPFLLDALSTQTLSKDYFEIILVDDHSTDNSYSVASSFIPRLPNLKVVTAPVHFSGKKAALTYGIGLAINPIIVFTDADCIPTSLWLESISKAAVKRPCFIIGAVSMTPRNSFSSKLQSLEYSSLMVSAAGSCGVGHPVIVSSANLAFSIDLIQDNIDLMNNNVSSGDDMFLLHHAKKFRNCRIRFLNDQQSIVRTSTEATISAALNQRKRWASKSIYYKDFDTICSGFVVLLFNLTLVLLFLASFLNVKWFYNFLILLVLKSLVDFLLIYRFIKFTRQDKLLRFFLPLQLLYPLYIVYSFFVGIIVKGHWKGRSIK